MNDKNVLNCWAVERVILMIFKIAELMLVETCNNDK